MKREILAYEASHTDKDKFELMVELEAAKKNVVTVMTQCDIYRL